MRISSLQAAAAAMLAAGGVNAQVLINDLTFGHTGQIDPNNARPQSVPNYKLQGDPRTPELYSNKIVLTPIQPGNQRGSIWSYNVLKTSEWTADIDFRATGPERGGGNLNIWLAKNGEADVGQSSIYTVNKFDGLALVMDTHGGSGGMIRGFLNDGKTDYRGHHSVDELAFGHCLYSYRNLGRPTQIKMRQTSSSFRVEVDGKLCFETDAFSVPPGNNFGITAATPEDNPDSFEVYKMSVLSETSADRYDAGNANHNQDAGRAKQRPPPVNDDAAAFEEIPDEDADVFQSSKAQFQDLHNRMQSTYHQIAALFRNIGKVQLAQTSNHQATLDLLNSIDSKISALDLKDLEERVKKMEKEMQKMRNELGRKISANENKVRGILTDHHATLSQTVIDSMPGHKRLFLIVVGTQIVVAAAYVVYKRRKANTPKKYL